MELYLKMSRLQMKFPASVVEYCRDDTADRRVFHRVNRDEFFEIGFTKLIDIVFDWCSEKLFKQVDQLTTADRLRLFE